MEPHCWGLYLRMQNTGTRRTNYKKRTISPIYHIPKITKTLETNTTLHTTKNTNNRGNILPQDRSSPQSVREKTNTKISGFVETTPPEDTRLGLQTNWTEPNLPRFEFEINSNRTGFEIEMISNLKVRFEFDSVKFELIRFEFDIGSKLRQRQPIFSNFQLK